MSSPVVFVISPEWTLRTMVRAELREAGVEALGMEGIRDMVEALHRGIVPAMIVIDGIELEKPVTRETMEDMSRNIPTLVVESRLTAAPVPSSAGAPPPCPGTRHRFAGAHEAGPQDCLKR